MATERLYYKDSHLIEFEARVIEQSERVSGWTAITLDQTAFYPTGGGQPSDTGTINGIRVVECIDNEDEGILHVVQGRAPDVGSEVRGRVDWLRRLDHIQQHTGQHILSQAFVQLFNAPTRSFRVMEQSCEIDVELSNPTNETIERAIELANNVVWEDREITIHDVTSAEAASMPLRKEPSRAGDLRLIEIQGFDLTPCGGTHAYRTGEVGMIAVRSWERAKGLVRIEFVAGMRALNDYRRANQSARNVATLFSCGRDDAPALAEKTVEENKELHRQVRSLEEIAARVEAGDLIAEAELHEGNLRIVSKVFNNRSAESLKHVAQAIIGHPNVVVLLASAEKDAARLIFARSADAPGDMNALMREACAIVEGKGGGKSDMAQGGGKNTARLVDALTTTKARLTTQGSDVR
jgi:alanyl-tRNA synthetase